MNDIILAPHFSITDAIRVQLDDIERNRWLFENMFLMPKHQAWIRRNVQVRRAAGTTAIEGANMDEASVERLVSSGRRATLDDDERANINAMKAYEFVDFLSDQPDIPVDELAIRQLDRYFMDGASETLTPGVYRKGENKISQFTPPNQGDVPALMRKFALWLRQDSEVHPVLKAGVAHIHFVAVHPFWDGNGRTARGLSTLLLQRSQFHFRKLLSLEYHLFEIRDEYIGAIERTLGNRFREDYDATPWLEFFTLALGVHLEVINKLLADWRRWMEEGHQFMEVAGAPARLADGLAFANQAGSMTRGDYVEITGVSPITASRDLAKLVEFGFLVPEGKTRSRVYRPAPEDAEPKDGAGAEQLPLLSDGPG